MLLILAPGIIIVYSCDVPFPQNAMLHMLAQESLIRKVMTILANDPSRFAKMFRGW